MKKISLSIGSVIILFIASFNPLQTSATKEEIKHKIAIVIDDFGNNSLGTKEMLALPIPITTAVMPFLPYSKSEAILAHEKGKEVIIHLPMESYQAKQSWYGPRPILTSMSDKEIKQIIYDAINDVPFAVGINNHMGSKATADERVMTILLKICKEKGYFFLNSRTNSSPIPKEIAHKLGVPYLENHLFFDHVYDAHHINKQAQLLTQKIDTSNEIIIIGHVGIPGKMTSNVISNHLPQLQKKATFYKVSQLVR